jgi:hypothetical protein
MFKPTLKKVIASIFVMFLFSVFANSFFININDDFRCGAPSLTQETEEDMLNFYKISPFKYVNVEIPLIKSKDCSHDVSLSELLLEYIALLIPGAVVYIVISTIQGRQRSRRKNLPES